MNRVTVLYTEPKTHDIKPNGGNHSHPGNKRYANIIRESKIEYVLADAKGKSEVIIRVYNTLKRGQFLQKENDGKYSVKDKMASLGKIRKALSENNAKIIEYLELRGKWTNADSRRKVSSMKGSRPCHRYPRKKPPEKNLAKNRSKKQSKNLSKDLSKKMSQTPVLSKMLKITSEDWKMLADALKRKTSK